MCGKIGAQFHGEFPEIGELFLAVQILFYAFQSILTFWLTFGKEDVNKYIKEFVTIPSLPRSYTYCKKDDTMDGFEGPEIANERSSRRKSFTILGYNFEYGRGGGDDANGDTYTSGNEDTEQKVGKEIKIIEDSSDDFECMVDSGDGNDGDGDDDVEVGIVADSETGKPNYKSRRISGGSAGGGPPLASGQENYISLQHASVKEIYSLSMKQTHV